MAQEMFQEINTLIEQIAKAFEKTKEDTSQAFNQEQISIQMLKKEDIPYLKITWNKKSIHLYNGVFQEK